MPESKNIFHQRGHDCERLAREYFQSKGYTVLFKNLALYFAEVDLLLLSPNDELIVVEVKSVREELAWSRPVSIQQTKRLKRVYESLIHSTCGISVRFHLAAVNEKNEVHVFEDFLSGV